MVLRRVRQSAVAVVRPRVPAILSRSSSPGETTILFQKGAVAVVCPRVPAVLSRPSSLGEATIWFQKEGAVAVVCPRVPAVLSRPSSPGEATILFQKEGAVAVVCPRVPAVLSRPSSPGEAAILSEKDLDWLQSGVVFPPPPAPHKGRRSVPWRQVKRRERRAALKFGYSTSATLKCPTSTLPCKYSGVSGQLPHGRFKRLDRSAASGPATPPPEAVRRPTLAPTAWAPFGGLYQPHH